MPHVLIISWEFPGVNTLSGTALVRRIGQISRGFDRSGWKVTVIHKDHKNEVGNSGAEIKLSENLSRYPIKSTNKYSQSKNPLIRKLQTLRTALFHGDITHEWFEDVKQFLVTNQIQKPDLIIACFTPRVPLELGKWASAYYAVPWIADIQDPLTQGSDKFLLRNLVCQWSKRILQSAKFVVHISPEWAKEAEAVLNREVITIRHAVPDKDAPLKQCTQNELISFLYAGSLNSDLQDPLPFLRVFDKICIRSANATLKFAMNESSFKKLEKIIVNNNLQNIRYQWLGWLNEEQLDETYYSSDVLVLIPWHSPRRVGVPSKLYEYFSYKKPILVAGVDSGGVQSLLNELNYPMVICDSDSKLESAIEKIVLHDYSKTLFLVDYKNKLVSEEDLVNKYIKLYEQ